MPLVDGSVRTDPECNLGVFLYQPLLALTSLSELPLL
jgi:hypothetical protein